MGLHVQVAGVGEREIEVFKRRDFGGNFAGIADEAAAHGIMDVCACTLDQRDDHAVGGGVDALQILRGLVGHRAETGVQIDLHQLLAVGRVDVIDGLRVQTGGVCVVGDDRLHIVVQIQADQPGSGDAGGGVGPGQKQDAVGIDGQHALCGRGVHRRVQAGYVDAAVSVQERCQFTIARNHVALAAGSDGQGWRTDENQSQHHDQ